MLIDNMEVSNRFLFPCCWFFFLFSFHLIACCIRSLNSTSAIHFSHMTAHIYDWLTLLLLLLFVLSLLKAMCCGFVTVNTLPFTTVCWWYLVFCSIGWHSFTSFGKSYLVSHFFFRLIFFLFPFSTIDSERWKISDI